MAADDVKDASIKGRFATGILGMSFVNSKGEFIGQCINCKWYNGDQKCDGFTRGIPDAIFDDALKHDVPLPRDNGFIFEPKALAITEG